MSIFKKSCSNCIKRMKCKASSTMKVYEDLDDRCVWWDLDRSTELQNVTKDFVKMKNVIPEVDARMFKLKRKESFEYPIADWMQLPTVNGIKVDAIYFNRETKQFSFSPYFSSNYNNISFIEQRLKDDKLQLKDFSLLFGKHQINDRIVEVVSIRFQTDTRGISGPDEAIDITAKFGHGQETYASLYPYSEDSTNLEYWNKLIQTLHNTELLDGELQYEVVSNFGRQNELRRLAEVVK